VRGNYRGPASARAVVASGVLLVVFGTLLVHADPIFASFISLPTLDIGELMSHVLIFGFFSWIVAGWMRSAVLDDAPVPRAPSESPIALNMLDVTMALGT